MTWSIRELADLAGVSPRTVRHYNQIGLLEKPDRLPNGYKRYGAVHLTRLRWIKQLTDLGFDLPRIAAIDGQDPTPIVKSLDAELAATIERLRSTRAELGQLLRDGAPIELPATVVPPAAERNMTRADRSFLTVMSRVLGPRQREAYTELVSNLPPDPAAREFERLSVEADNHTRRELAERMVGYVGQIHRRHPALVDLHADAPFGRRFARQAVAAATRELYNPAQREVMARVEAAFQRAPQ